jgi:hypothetical protein
MSHETESLALHYNVPLALAALLLAGCATPPDPELCRIARADVAAGESCLAEPTCAAKWDSATFRMTIESARDDARRYCTVRP